LEGRKDVLGLWTSGNEGAKFWLSVLTELKNRGVKDVLIACVDGLKGLPQAIESVFPEAQVQLCIVHLVRASLKYVSWKERKQVAADLKLVYRARHRTSGQTGADRVHRQVGKQIPGGRQTVGGQLGSSDSVLRVSAGDPAGDLH